MRIPTKPDTHSDRSQTAFRLIADSFQHGAVLPNWYGGSSVRSSDREGAVWAARVGGEGGRPRRGRGVAPLPRPEAAIDTAREARPFPPIGASITWWCWPASSWAGSGR